MLLDILTDRTETQAIRQAVAQALGQCSSTQIIPAFLQFLASFEDKAVRHAVTQVLGQLCDPQHALTDDNAYIRLAAIEALGKTGNTQAIPLLAPLLTDKITFVREAVIEALGRIGSTQAIGLITPMLNDRSEVISEAATWVVEKLRNAQSASHLRQTTAEILGQQVNESHNRESVQRTAEALAAQLSISRIFWKQLWKLFIGSRENIEEDLDLTAIEATLLALEQAAHRLVVLDVQALPNDPLSSL
jgi:HEAT repeat protein